MTRPLLSKRKEQALQELLGRATDLHRRGGLAEAGLLYRQVLELDPRQADAQHLLGVVRAQQGQLPEALDLVAAALRSRPDSAVILSDYGLVLHKLGRHEEAIAGFDRALAIKPDHVAALGNRGNALASLARHDEALASYDRALKIRPDFPEALCNRGHALAALGRYDEALASYARALAIRPQDADACLGRARVLGVLGRHDDALAGLRRALAIRPGDAQATFELANTLAGLKRFEEAVAAYDAVLAHRPDDAAALANRGNALLYLNRHEAALASYDRALAVRPDDGAALNGRGTALKGLKRPEDALASFAAALAADPAFADALYNSANVLKDLKRYDEALTAYDRARGIAPDHPDAFGLTDAALAVCDWNRIAPLRAALATRIESGIPFTPFALLGLCDDPALHQKCATSYVADRMADRQARTIVRGRAEAPKDKIRIAYFSADFHEHATAYLIAGLIERHDRARFDVLGVSFGRDDQSAMRRRLLTAFDQFHDVQAMSDRAAVELLSGLDIDIAIDLKGYTQGARPELFGGRVAPVQVNYLGYPGTMAADFIDYVIADAIALPFDQQPFYTEKIVHLPDCYQVNDDRRAIAERTPSRRQMGLPEQGFVFCCFNNSYKIAPPVFDVWMRLLQAVPDSVLWLLGDTVAAMTNLRREAQARALDPARLVFADRCGLEDHLARHRLADLFLDTLPYNAHTTASDALWADLPVLTCEGRAFAGRVAASLLHAVGLPELVTNSLADYEALALRLARDQGLLQAIRAKLARQRLASPLFDTGRSTRQIEAAYLTMWDIWQREEQPRSFAVEAISSFPATGGFISS